MPSYCIIDIEVSMSIFCIQFGLFYYDSNI